jgi:hypothetical protein
MARALALSFQGCHLPSYVSAPPSPPAKPPVFPHDTYLASVWAWVARSGKPFADLWCIRDCHAEYLRHAGRGLRVHRQLHWLCTEGSFMLSSDLWMYVR